MMNITTDALATRFRQSSFVGAVVDVIRKVDQTHRRLAPLLFESMRYDSWQARDHKDGAGGLRIETQVAADGRDGAVFVDLGREGL